VSQWYVDSSAAMKLVVDEPESAALAEVLDAEVPDLVGTWLLETEMRRAAHRIDSLAQEMVSEILRAVGIYEMPASLFREAGLLLGVGVRSLDALHLAAAVRIGVDQIITYDERMAESARQLGLSVLAPGAPTIRA
jgi:predicted nucleic acid-binding protein